MLADGDVKFNEKTTTMSEQAETFRLAGETLVKQMDDGFAKVAQAQFEIQQTVGSQAALVESNFARFNSACTAKISEVELKNQEHTKHIMEIVEKIKSTGNATSSGIGGAQVAADPRGADPWQQGASSLGSAGPAPGAGAPPATPGPGNLVMLSKQDLQVTVLPESPKREE